MHRITRTTTFLGHIDPSGGKWLVQRIGEHDLRPCNAWINFSAGGFLNHGAGCAGWCPAFCGLSGKSARKRRSVFMCGGRAESV